MKKLEKTLPAILAAALLLTALAGCGKSAKALKADADAKLPAGTKMSMSELLYFNGDDLDAIDPNRVYTVQDDGSIAVSDVFTGESSESLGGSASYADVTKKLWSERFGALDIDADYDGYSDRIEYSISDNNRFYLMDDEVWLGYFDDSGNVTALVKLQKS